MITVDVDTKGLKKKLELLVAASGKTMQEVLPPEARLLAVELARYTQPFGDGRAKGEGAIKRDYGRVYPEMDSEFVLKQVEKRAGKGQENSTKRRWERYAKAEDQGALREMAHDMKLGEVARRASPSFHKSRWNRGKLRKGKMQFVSSRASVNTITNKAVKMVGFAKAGWAVCASLLGGMRGIPQWVTRHRNSPGRVVDKSKAPNHPSIQIINGINYTSQVLSQTAKSQAIRDREIKLKKRIDQVLKTKARAL